MSDTLTPPAAQAVTEHEKYFFDLNGYIILRGAVDADHVAAMNAILDSFIEMDPPLEHGEWVGGMHCHTYSGNEGFNFQQVYETGEPFERLIDHPAWIEKVKTFVGGQNTFDAMHGPLFIDENFASIRGPGDYITMHSGGHTPTKRTQYKNHNREFMCSQVNVLLALTDIGPGDGGTMVIPGSHKQTYVHPWAATRSGLDHPSMDDVEGAIEVHLNKGDTLMFTDAIAHGSAVRKNDGLRRITVYRYGPSWGFFRHPYRPSLDLLERLTPQRAQIVMPHKVMPRTPNRVEGFPAIDTPAGPMLAENKSKGE